MPYINAISPDAYGQYNRTLAKQLGLPAAVYASEILDISAQVYKKGKFSADGFWKLDRKYLEDRTTLTPEQQEEVESILVALEILDKQGKNQLRFRLDKLFNILSGDVTISEEQLSVLCEKKPKLTKKEAILLSLKKCINEPDPDLHLAYENWLDVVYEKGVCKKVQIESFINDINNYTTDKATKLAILKVATQAGYKVAEWCFTKTRTGKTAATLPTQKISTGEIDTNQSF